MARRKLVDRLPASLLVMRHRNFRLVAIGNFVSALGNWSSMVGIGWAARGLTDSAQAITLAFAAQFIPNLLFASVGGMWADRMDRRRLTIIGNLAMAVPSLAIGLLITTDHLTLTWLVILAFLGGAASAVTMPASQALVPHLVPEDEVQMAVSLTSALQNGSRLVGAAMAGVIISVFGTAMAFYWNAISFLAVVWAWLLVKMVVVPVVHAVESMASRLAGGIRYARKDQTVRYLLFLNVAMAILILQSSLLPILVKDVLHAQVSAYAYLQMGTGIGAVTGALLAGQWTTDRRRRQAIAVGMLVNATAVTGIAFSRWVPVSVGLQVLFGLGFFTVSTVTQSMIMMSSEDAYLGRVMGLYTMALAGMLPFNALLAGFLADHFGTVKAIAGAGVLLFAYAFWFISFRLPKVGVDHLHEVALTAPPAPELPAEVSAELSAEAATETVAASEVPLATNALLAASADAQLYGRET
ncbi:MAG TPA: MFS transporter [Acidimicrobiales bacterium]